MSEYMIPYREREIVAGHMIQQIGTSGTTVNLCREYLIPCESRMDNSLLTCVCIMRAYVSVHDTLQRT